MKKKINRLMDSCLVHKGQQQTDRYSLDPKGPKYGYYQSGQFLQTKNKPES